ncbi:thiamine pyrophosphate-binding protein [Pseudohoeflea coraliihabitans]|uniref:Thiamine pyrophosphate-binding protein n=1 Tax=Pseudohoeflea coraliihabitans TaxID=2860393 RepID=A0ABS6WJ45_9HYPH|nr:thiamine pyrophosphate-binding protein [Pseudohoeflea sp. DP4N28-3]MBW3095951.1 thiamine pyrophosphate-binding protein [Pseudohoeflea sp. DP4N28-3]
MTENKRTGGQLIVDCLAANDVSHAFCVPGESYLAVLDALHDSTIETIVCRQEGGAAMMADAWGKMTGRPGICFVTRGPGAANATAGLHIARQDSTPMILFIGQVQRDAREREAFQEIEYRRALGEYAKWVAEIDDAACIPEFLARAFRVATSGRPGPVVLSMPEDMLRDVVESPVVPRAAPPVAIPPAPSQMSDLAHRLDRAERPLIILGGSGWTAKAKGAIETQAEKAALPICCSLRRQMLFDHLHPSYAGDVGIAINPALAEEVRTADLIVLVGGRMSEMPSSGYTLLDIPYPAQDLIHVHADVGELGRVYQPSLAICADPASFAEAFAALDLDEPNPARAERTARMHQAYLDWSTPPLEGPGKVQMGAVMAWLEDNLPPDAILTNGAGNYATWVHRFHRFRNFASQAAPTSGSMGYGLPGAIGAVLANPERLTIAFAGDGCFLMTGQEFATAVHYRLPIIVIVVNNGMYGTIRMHQERDYPGRVSGTGLTNPDFAAYARAFGGHGETVETSGEFAAAFERARQSGLPAIIEIRQDPEAITPARTLSDIRDAARP